VQIFACGIRTSNLPLRSSGTSRFSAKISKETTVQVGYVGQYADHLAQPMWLKQNILNANGTVSTGPYLNGNPTLRAKIGAISGTFSNAWMDYNALQAVLAGESVHRLFVPCRFI